MISPLRLSLIAFASVFVLGPCSHVVAYPTYYSLNYPGTALTNQGYYIESSYRNGYYYDYIEMVLRKNGSYFASSIDTPYGNLTVSDKGTTPGYNNYELNVTELSDPSRLHEYDYYNDYFSVRIVAPNYAPEISWENLPSIVYAGQAITVRARAIDSNGNLTTILMDLNGGAHRHDGFSGGLTGNGSNAYLDSYTVTAGSPGSTYLFTAKARDADGAESATISHAIVVANRAPSLSMSANGTTATGGQTQNVSVPNGTPLTFYFSASDPDGNYQRTRLWLSTDSGASWQLLYNSTAPSGSFSYVLDSIGTHLFRANAIDDSSADSGDAILNITSQNRAPGPSSLSATKTTMFVGETTRLTATLADADGNMDRHGIWWDCGIPGSSWIHPQVEWGAPSDATGWSNISTQDLTPSNPYYSVITADWTPTSNGTYRFHCAGGDSAGGWGGGAELTITVANIPADTEPPSTPANLTADDISANSFTLSWNPSTDNVGVTGYEVRQDGVTISDSVNGTQLFISNLQRGTTYSMTVRARDGAGNWSAWSTVMTVKTSVDDVVTLPPGWASQHGLSVDDPLGDPDHDGLTNIAEYNLGTNPKKYNAGTSELNNSVPAIWNLVGNTSATSPPVGITVGELSVDQNGTATYSVPIAVAQGSAGMEPKLSLNYNSHAGAGIAGFGWSLGGASAITRGPQTVLIDNRNRPVSFDRDDRFYLDGQRLILVSGSYGGNGAEYRTEIESFTRIVSYGATSTNNSPVWFRAWTKAGLVMDFGKTSDSSLCPGNQADPLIWAVSKISDTAGNYITFHYEQDYDNGQQLLDEIKYTGHQSSSKTVAPYASVVFEYQDRTDKTHRYIGGVKTSSLKRLQKIKTQVNTAGTPVVVRSYELGYIERGPTGRSMLASIVEKGRDGGQLQPLTFEYSDPPNGFSNVVLTGYILPGFGGQSGSDPLPAQGVMFADLNGDGLMNCIQSHIYKTGNTTYHDRKAYLYSKTGWKLADGSNGQPDFRTPTSVVFANDTNSSFKNDISFVDINGDGKIDMMTSRGTVHINTGSSWFANSGWGPPVDYPGEIPDEWLDWQPKEHCSWYMERSPGKVMDLNGDGRPDFTAISTFYVDQWRGYYTAFSCNDAWLNIALPDGGSTWVHAPEYAIAADDAIAIDLNGDGLDDLVCSVYKNNKPHKYVYLNTGSGWQYSTDYQLPFYLSGTTSQTGAYSYGGCEFVDLNGDGLPDIVAYNNNSGAMSQYGVYYNTGKGWTPAPDSMNLPVGLAWANKSNGCAFADVNNDGLPDLVQAIDGSSQTDGTRVTWLNTGTSWQRVYDHTNFNLPYPLYKTTPGAPTGLVLRDMNGDGVVDVIWSWKYNNYPYDYGHQLNKRVNPDRLIKVINGFGISSSLEYGVITNPASTSEEIPFYEAGEGTKRPQFDVMGPYTVVKKVSHDDGVGGTYFLDYRYGGLRAEPSIGQLGYEWQSISDSRTGLRTVTEYSQDYPTIGQPTAIVTIWEDDTGNNITLYRKIIDYNVKSLNNGKNLFPYVETIIEETHELNGELTSKKWTYSEYDDFGNATLLEEDASTGDQPGQYTTKTQNTYANTVASTPASTDLSAWILGRLTHSRTTTSVPGSQGVRTSSFTYDPATGFITSETIEPDAGVNSPLKLTTTYGYDSFGHKASVTTSGAGISPARTSTTEYDSLGRFPALTTNALGHSESFVYDQELGVLLSQTGPNGLVTNFSYDEFGRNVSETRMDSTVTVTLRQWATAQAPDGAVYLIKTETTGAAPSIDFFDCMGRTISSWRLNPMPDGSGNGRIVSTETFHDAMGRAYATSLPHFLNNAPAGWTETLKYDILNRPLIISTPDDNPDAVNGRAVSTVTYSGLSTATTNALGQVEYIEKDTQDRVVVRVNNAEATDPNERGEIHYTYDCFGNLEKTSVLTETDAAIETIYTYDLRGRKLTMTDPDMGTWSYSYNAASELVSQTDAKGQLTTMQYDSLGRITKRTDHDSTVTTWSYDTASLGTGATAGVAKGKLASVQVTKTQPTVEAYTYSESYSYDHLVRPSSHTRVIEGQSYTTGQTYDFAGRLSTTIYPGGFCVKNHYDNLGFLKEVRADDGVAQSGLLNDVSAKHRFWQAESYTVSGVIKNSTLGNGLHYDRIISEVTGRVMAVTSGIGADTQVQFHEYTYDLLGQVKTRLDHMMGRSESYTHDGLNRLVGYNLTTVSPIVPGVPAAIPMQLAMQYNALGNITRKSDVGMYYYAPGRPRAVTSVYDAASNITRNYTYDANGNQLSGPGRTLEWSASNQVKKITGGGKTTEFLFGASRERIVQKQSGGTTTIYVGSIFEVVLHAGGLREEKYHIHTPLGRTATRTLRSDSLVETRYYHQDALGSIVAVSDEYGRVEKRFTYDPWGVREISLDTRLRDGGAVTRGFTDHEHLNDFGLIHMNGRVFDPVLARFLSPDPYVNCAEWSQSYNRYSYVDNNPLNATDPSGYFKLSFKAIAIIVAVIVISVLSYGAASAALGPAFASAFGVSASVGAGMAGGLVAGFVGGFVGTMISGGSLYASFTAGIRGGIAGFVAGGVAGYYNNVQSWEKIVAKSLAGGFSSEVTGGDFEKGMLIAGAMAINEWGWQKAKEFTDSTAKKAAETAEKRNHWITCEKKGEKVTFEVSKQLKTTDSKGNLLTAGILPREDGDMIGPKWLNRMFQPLKNITTTGDSTMQGSADQWYNKNWLGGKEGFAANLIEKTSKLHDWFNGWTYSSETGYYISRGNFYDTLVNIYSYVGMPVAGVFTVAAHIDSMYVISTYNAMKPPSRSRFIRNDP